MNARFGLGDDLAWIPVADARGDVGMHTLRSLLVSAHTLQEIAAEPAEWAGLMRFLPSVLALVARQDPAADFEGWAEAGIPAGAVDAALGNVADHLWLQHPVTPFMQDMSMRTVGEANRPDWLALTQPAASSKAWWGKPGDRSHPDEGDPARVARGLVTSWFLSPGVGGRAACTYPDDPDTRWRPRGTLTFRNHGLRVFWRGGNLAETLLANTMGTHTRGKPNLPLWADPHASIGSGTLTDSTWTGSVYRLVWDADRVTGVLAGGRRLRDMDAERDIWRADPTIPRASVRKAGEETNEVRPLRALHPMASSVQWAAEWYAEDSRRSSARALEPGLVEVTGADIVSVRLEGRATAPEMGHLTRVDAGDIAVPAARGRLRALSSLILTPVRSTLYVGAKMAFGETLSRQHQDALFGVFCTHAEPVLDDIVHAETFTREDAARFAQCAVTAIEQYLATYLNPRMLSSAPGRDGAAAALAFVRARSAASVRKVA